MPKRRTSSQKPFHQNQGNLISCKAEAVVLPLKKVSKRKLRKCYRQYLTAQFVLVNVSYQQQHFPLAMLSLFVHNCLEQWIESSSSPSKCPLCRTTADYAPVPLVLGIANISGQKHSTQFSSRLLTLKIL